MAQDGSATNGARDAAVGYLGVGALIGVVVGVITFIAAYLYCIATYGFLFGLGLGWLPSAILAGIAGAALVFL